MFNPSKQAAYALAIALIVMLCCCGGYSQASRKQAQVISQADRAAIDRIMSSVYKPDLPGAAIIVLRNGKPIFRKGYGLANLELRVAVRPEMVFRICSVTKQFTAVAIMMLAEQRKLSLDDDIRKF